MSERRVDYCEQIERFFLHPLRELPSGLVSVLYRVRVAIRQAIDASLVEPNPGEDRGAVLWLAAIGALTGIDLLAKLDAGRDKSSRRDFSRFVERYFCRDNVDQSTKAKVLYQLRCAMIHSFALRSDDGENRSYRFVLSQDRSQLVDKVDSATTQGFEEWRVDLRQLCEHFERAVEAFQKEVLTRSPEKKEAFVKLLDRFGWVEIVQPPSRRSLPDGVHIVYRRSACTSAPNPSITGAPETNAPSILKEMWEKGGRLEPD